MKRPILIGVILTLVGLVLSYATWSLAALYAPICDGYWDRKPGCIALYDKMKRWSFAPLPGVALTIYGVVRRRWLRSTNAT
jgi:hypothetical protein